MLRSCVLFVLAVLLLAACGETTPTELTVGEGPPSSTTTVLARDVHDVHRAPPTTAPPTTTTAPAPEPSTTTTMPPSPTPPPAEVATINSTGQVNGYPCGGDLPPCWVLQRESGGDPTAVNPTGCGGASCGGLWQFDPRTWDGFGGYTYAQDAPADVQNQAARQLWAGGAGCSHWAAC